MENRKYLFVNVCITALLIAGGIWVASSRTQADYGPMQEMLNRQTKIINDKLSQIENSLDGMEANVAGVQKGAPSGNNEFEKINRKLNTILAKIASIEVGARSYPSGGMRPPSMPGYQAMPGREEMPGGREGRGTRWINTLPKEKQEAVEQIFRENALVMKEQFGAEREEGRISTERLAEIRAELDESLREALQEVLNEEEYEEYLNQRPERALSKGSLPGLPHEPSGEDSR